MTTRKPLHQVFELGSAEPSKLDSTEPLSQHPVPSLDERANIYLRAVYGSQDLAGEEFARARLRILDAMAEQIASEVPARVRVSNKWVPARPHSAGRWGAKAIAACAFVALIVAAGSFSYVWLPATDLHAELDPLTTQDTKTNPDTSLTARQYAAKGGHPNRPVAQDTQTNPNTSVTARLTALGYGAESGGDAVAQWKLGRMYANGDGVIQDDLRAFEYFSRIANQHAGDSPSAPQAATVANAFVALGRYYLNGIPNSKIKADTDRAREMFSYAASYFDNADAQYDLARLYLKDAGSSRDDFRYGARWLGLAAEKGQHQAQAMLGQMLFNGDRMPREAARGLMWLTLARDRAAADETWIKESYDRAIAKASEDDRAMAQQMLKDRVQGKGDAAENGGVPADVTAPVAKPVAAAPAPEPAQTRVAATNPVQTVPSAGSGYLVQVSSEKNEADAQASYRALQSKFPSVLGSRSPVIKRADLGDKGVYYRAMVGPFGTYEEATQLCGKLKTAGGQCIVQIK